MEQDTPEIAVHPEFQKSYQKLIDVFFSRNIKLWPIYKYKGFQEVIANRRIPGVPYEKLNKINDADKLVEELMSSSEIQDKPYYNISEGDPVLKFVASLSKNWEDPNSVENVVSMSSDPAIYGAMMGLLSNANLVHPEYAGYAHEM